MNLINSVDFFNFIHLSHILTSLYQSQIIYINHNMVSFITQIYFLFLIAAILHHFY